METTRTLRSLRMMAAILLLSILFALWLTSSTTVQGQLLFSSPLSTPLVPTPTSTPPSAESQIALRYVAQRYSIPKEQLAVVNEHYLEYAELGRAFQAFALFDPTGKRFFQLLVDLKDHTVVEDVAAIDQVEADATQKKYGKLEPSLYERLSKAASDELVDIAIWIAGKPHRSQPELFAELAARFPEAKTALERSGKPFDIPDSEARVKVEQVYSAMLEMDTQPMVQPVVSHLQAQGYAVATYGSLPSVTAKLPKSVILALTKRPDVGKIFLVEGEVQLLSFQ